MNNVLRAIKVKRNCTGVIEYAESEYDILVRHEMRFYIEEIIYLHMASENSVTVSSKQ